MDIHYLPISFGRFINISNKFIQRYCQITLNKAGLSWRIRNFPSTNCQFVSNENLNLNLYNVSDDQFICIQKLARGFTNHHARKHVRNPFIHNFTDDRKHAQKGFIHILSKPRIFLLFICLHVFSFRNFSLVVSLQRFAVRKTFFLLSILIKLNFV